jgi:yecA family protein
VELMTDMINYDKLNYQLIQHKIGITAAELHGFLVGILAGGNHDQSWRPLVDDMLNNGQAIAEPLIQPITQLYHLTKQQLSDEDFEFQLFLSEHDLFTQIDDLVGWVNHFLLGIGLVQPKINRLKGDVGEAIYDLRQIVKLGYDKNENEEELGFAFEEIKEYVRITAVLCFDEFNEVDITPTIH